MEYSKEKKKKEVNKPNKSKHIHSENRVALIRGEGAAGREKWVKKGNCMETEVLVVSML